MNQKNRQKVLDYINGDFVDSTAPLIFHEYESPKEEFDPSKYSVENMVRRCIELNYNYNSINSESQEIETYRSRSRSSLDIWRHIKYYYPDIEIFDVMSSLHKIYMNKEIRGIFCNDIKRRVFRIHETDQFHNDEWKNWQRSEEMYGYCNRNVDEYGLDWEDWKEI